MKVQEMLAEKGAQVVTVRPDATVETAVHRLKLERIGALVVTDADDRIQGIISERDIVRALVTHGAETLRLPVSDLMTRAVRTCVPQDNIRDVMSEMTRSRIRHLPILDGGKLCGIISIGDVVKNRLEELETEANVLRDYIVGRS